jgi:predicted MFS family arabinose efflux permease
MDVETPVVDVAETPATTHTPMHLQYFALLRRNANFRRLWMAQLISEIGDWFYSLAVYDLLLLTTHTAKAVSWAIIIQTLPWFFLTPLAGHVVDHFSRRRLMILADVVRGFVVLGLLWVRTPSDVWLVYVLLGSEVIFASFFEPARTALLPNIAEAEELLPANALSSATWSLALTVGAALGGAVTAVLGRDVAFAVNSLSFFASAWLILRIHVRESHLEPASSGRDSAQPQGLRSLQEGWEYFRHNPKVAVLTFAKTGLGILGGSLLLLSVFGERVFPVAGRGALAMGLLYSARGVGAGMGPLIGDYLTRGRESRMWKIIGFSYFLVGTSYLVFSRAPNLGLGAIAIFFAHCGGSNVWVMSTTLLQLNTADRFRGRVFALDLGMIMLAAAGANYLLGVGFDNWGLGARRLAAAMGVALILPGVLWLPVQARWATEPVARDE